jgi:hypothetical protein
LLFKKRQEPYILTFGRMPQLKLVISEVSVVCTNGTLTAVDLFDPVTFKTFQNSIKGQHIDLVKSKSFIEQLY